MRRRGPSRSTSSASPSSRVQIILAVIGLIGVLIPAVLVYWQNQSQLTIPLHATQTAEARIATQLAQGQSTATHAPTPNGLQSTLTLSPNLPTRISGSQTPAITSLPPSSVPIPTTLVASETQQTAPAIVTSGTTMLYSSLDSSATITTPEVGIGGIVLNLTEHDFVPGKVGSGLAFVREGMTITFPIAAGDVSNIDFNHGEVEFWFRPNYDAQKPPAGRQMLFRAAFDDYNPPALSFGIEGGRLVLTVQSDSKSEIIGTAAPFSAPLWKSGDWIHMRAHWDNASEKDSLQIYINDNRVDLDRIPGDWSIDISNTRTLFIGQLNGQFPAGGIIDDFIIRR